MTGYTPEQMPVLSALAAGSRRSTTGSARCRRRPSPTGPSSTPASASARGQHPVRRASRVHNTAETLFERLDAAGLTWRVYCDPPCALLAHRADPRAAARRPVRDQLLLHRTVLRRTPSRASCRPTRSSSRNHAGSHNDMHPPFRRDPPRPRRPTRPPRCSAARTCWPGSTTRSAPRPRRPARTSNTLLLVAFDEHGGTYDHVPPPRVPPPDPAAPAGHGLPLRPLRRAHPDARRLRLDPGTTVVNDEFRATSLIRRCASASTSARRSPPATPAPPTSPRSSRWTAPRAQEDWPEVTARQVPSLSGTLAPMNKPLPPLGKALLGVAIALDTMNTGHVPDIDPNTATGQHAHDYMIDRQARIWPGLTR